MPYKSKVYQPVPRKAIRSAVAKSVYVQREYDTHRWKVARSLHLQREPLCRAHDRYGYAVAAEVVDHIRPHRDDMSLFWDESNWQSLCKRCHDRKTAAEVNCRSRGIQFDVIELPPSEWDESKNL